MEYLLKQFVARMEVNMNIINKSDKKYPENLRNIKNPPKKLYTIGNINLLNEINIAIVGSRNSTDYGERNAKKWVLIPVHI